jgi:hypothetical protein
MNTWIFQSVPERYDLRKASSIRPGDTVTWYATRYRDQMTPGDTVYFWMGGEEDIRGIYGWGELISDAYIRKDWDAHGVDAKIKARFKEPILASVLKKDRRLANLLIFRQPQASNFLLEPQEAEVFAKIVQEKREIAPTRKGTRDV